MILDIIIISWFGLGITSFILLALWAKFLSSDKEKQTIWQHLYCFIVVSLLGPIVCYLILSELRDDIKTYKEIKEQRLRATPWWKLKKYGGTIK